MKEIKVAVIAHGLGSSRGYSGEGYVYKVILEMLRERGINHIVISFAKPYDTSLDAVYFSPFHMRRFDKYQRLIVYFPAKRVKPVLYLNVSGTPLPLSTIAPHIIYAGAPAIANVPSKYTKSLFWKMYLMPFKFIVSKMREEAKRAKIIANSLFSAKAIAETYSIPQPQVIYPPVNVDFYSRAYTNEEREDFFVTIGRFERGKMIENAIIFSSLSKIRGVVIGNLSDKKYFKELVKLKERVNANVEFLPNLPREEVLKVLSKAKLYFHPTIGEHFGIPIVEAMAAGLIPIVPKESGGSEIVPEFSYSTLEEASSIARNLIENSSNLSKEMHERAKAFDKEIFKENIFRIVKEYLIMK